MAQPRPPSVSSISGKQFPEDLGNLGYYMTFVFSEYRRSSPFSPAQLMPGSTPIALPMPDTINDNPSVVWEPISATKEVLGGAEKIAGDLSRMMPVSPLTNTLVDAGSIAGGLALKGYGATMGKTINPFLIMLFKQPDYKRFKFSWTLTPRTQKESDTLNDIVKAFRKNMMPDVQGGGIQSAIMDFPLIVKPSFHPDDYMFKFKPCAIRAINIDYTGAGMPAFFTTDAPVAVRLDIDLMEIDLWMRSDMELM